MSRCVVLRRVAALVGVFVLSSGVHAAPVDSEPGIPKGVNCESYQGNGDYLDGNLVGFGENPPSNYALIQGFTPPNYPWKYNAFCVCLRGNDLNTTFLFDVVVLDDDGPKGGPGTVIQKFRDKSMELPSGNSCNYSIIPNLDIPAVYSGKIYIGLSWSPTSEPGVAWGVDASNNGIPSPIFRSFDDLQSWEDETGSYFALNFRANGALLCEQSFQGRITTDSPTWNRVSTLASSLNCDAVAANAAEGGQYYQAIPISSETGGNLVFEIQDAGGGLSDTTLALYCDPFDPENPSKNLIAYDDDGGPGSLSAFTYDDKLILAPGETYWLVVSAFAPGGVGNYQACISNGYRIGLCNQVVSGDLSAASPMFQRPTVQSASSPEACNAIAVDAPVSQTPYEVYQLTVDAPALLEAEVLAVSDGLTNAYLLLYCDFDPQSPLSNIVMGDDSGGDAGLGQIAPEDGVYLSPDAVYYLVVTSDLPSTSGLGAYQLCVSPGVNIQHTALECTGDAAYSQPPSDPTGNWVASAVGTSVGGEYLDNFSGLKDPITRVTWWALHVLGGELPCDRKDDTTFVRFLEDNDGKPGTVARDEESIAVPIPTGLFYYQGGAKLALYRYDVTLATPLDLSAGWLSVGAVGNDTCRTHWLSARTGGDGTSLHATTGEKPTEVTNDYAFCLFSTAATHTTDQDGDFVISLSELLRIIQFYNSGSLHCDAQGEDGFAPGPGVQSCTPHDADYAPQDWIITLSELLRVIQFYNSLGYSACPDQNTEDGYCPGPAS